MKPKMEAKVGDKVQRGQLLFEDRKAPGVRFTAPAAGTVVAIHRGEKRAFQPRHRARRTDDQVDLPAYSGPSARRAPRRRRGQGPAARVGPVDRDPHAPLLARPRPRRRPARPVRHRRRHQPARPRRRRRAQGQARPTSSAASGPRKLAPQDLPLQVQQAAGRHRRRPQPPGRGLRRPAPRRQRRHPHPHARRPSTASRVVWHIGYQDVAPSASSSPPASSTAAASSASPAPSVKRPACSRPARRQHRRAHRRRARTPARTASSPAPSSRPQGHAATSSATSAATTTRSPPCSRAATASCSAGSPPAPASSPSSRSTSASSASCSASASP
jgi:hypothetical protein